MVLLFTSIALLGLFTARTRAHVSSGRTGYGLIGYGIVMYDPPCAYACRDSVSSWMLDCPDDEESMDMMDMMSMLGMSMHDPSPECLTTNDPFLQTLAWCIYSHCEGEHNSTLENWWEMNVAGRQTVQPLPKYSYQNALEFAAASPPTAILDADATLNTTSLIDEDGWLAGYNGDRGFEKMEIVAEKYAIILMVTCTVIPIAFSWLSYLPLPQSFVSKFYSYVIDPPAFGSYHAVPVLGLGFVPTRGQMLFIAYIWIVNIVLSATGYEIQNPMSWYATLEQQLMAYITNRVGVFSFVNLAITVLFSSRNNVLLYLTNWSHSTFLLVHRWVAVICMLQACLHSAIYLQIYLDPSMGEGAYATESALSYWIWGAAATMAFVVLMPLSIYPLRRKAYEIFLATHVAISLLAMIGCFLHMYFRYELQWGYQNWVILAFVIWGFDRLLARPLRLAKNGIKKAYISIIDEDYMMVEIPGVHADGQAYLYFPTLTWRFWENHPFTVAAMSGQSMPNAGHLTTRSSSAPSTSASNEEEKKGTVTIAAHNVLPRAIKAPGIVFFVRRRGGLTTKLAKIAESSQGISVLVEGSYGPEMSIVQSPKSSPSVEHPNIICIAGGVGITAILPVLTRMSNLLPSWGRTKLFWGVRTEPLVQAVQDLIGVDGSTISGKSVWGTVDVSISVGERFKIRDLLKTELQGMEGGTTVVVCGPPGMADEVRLAVTGLGQKGFVVRLTEESFSW